MEFSGVVLRNTFLEFSEDSPKEQHPNRSRAMSDVSHLNSREWQIAKISMRDGCAVLDPGKLDSSQDSPARASSTSTEAPSPGPAQWSEEDAEASPTSGAAGRARAQTVDGSELRNTVQPPPPLRDRSASEKSSESDFSEVLRTPGFVVRNTFIELDEEEPPQHRVSRSRAKSDVTHIREHLEAMLVAETDDGSVSSPPPSEPSEDEDQADPSMDPLYVAVPAWDASHAIDPAAGTAQMATANRRVQLQTRKDEVAETTKSWPRARNHSEVLNQIGSSLMPVTEEPDDEEALRASVGHEKHECPVKEPAAAEESNARVRATSSRSSSDLRFEANQVLQSSIKLLPDLCEPRSSKNSLKNSRQEARIDVGHWSLDLSRKSRGLESRIRHSSEFHEGSPRGDESQRQSVTTPVSTPMYCGREVTLDGFGDLLPDWLDASIPTTGCLGPRLRGITSSEGVTDEDGADMSETEPRSLTAELFCASAGFDNSAQWMLDPRRSSGHVQPMSCGAPVTSPLSNNQASSGACAARQSGPVRWEQPQTFGQGQYAQPTRRAEQPRSDRAERRPDRDRADRDGRSRQDQYGRQAYSQEQCPRGGPGMTPWFPPFASMGTMPGAPGTVPGVPMPVGGMGMPIPGMSGMMPNMPMPGMPVGVGMPNMSMPGPAAMGMGPPGGMPGIPYPWIFPQPSQAPHAVATPAPRTAKKKKKGQGGAQGGAHLSEAQFAGDATAGGNARKGGPTTASHNSEAPPPPTRDATTVVLKNIPQEYDSQMLVKLFEKEGFHERFDYIYMPVGFQDGVNLGYAFVNLISHEDALDFARVFHGFWTYRAGSARGEITWAHPCQGFVSHVERYRNSPVMHPSVPDAYKPMIFKNGQRVPFPKPTKPLGQPKGVSRRHVASMGGI
mmetsp:Transcript_49370/g.130942  ORF Transcript_49370/g.130942 Transcript_49370/m.130942 type:complete len:898 (-) Transcript_49370:290-2983(-)